MLLFFTGKTAAWNAPAIFTWAIDRFVAIIQDLTSLPLEPGQETA